MVVEARGLRCERCGSDRLVLVLRDVKPTRVACECQTCRYWWPEVCQIEYRGAEDEA